MAELFHPVRLCWLVLGIAGALNFPARGAPPPPAGPALLCRAAIASVEAATHIPEAFLSAIGRVESGRVLSQGLTAPWPWTVNAAGQGYFYASKPEAIAAVQAFQAQGVRSLDVGCLQVSLLYHKDAFTSLDQAFDPAANAAFAARLLLSLRAQTGSWPLAAASYHSQTPALGREYAQKVLAEWAAPQDGGEPHGGAPDRAAAPPSQKAAARLPQPAPPSIFHGATSLPVRMGGGLPPGTGRTLAVYRSMPIRLMVGAPLPLLSH